MVGKNKILIAKTEEECQKYDRLGYQRMDWDSILSGDKTPYVFVRTYSVDTTAGREIIARLPDVGNIGGSGKTEAEAIKDVMDNLLVEMNLRKMGL